MILFSDSLDRPSCFTWMGQITSINEYHAELSFHYRQDLLLNCSVLQFSISSSLSSELTDQARRQAVQQARRTAAMYVEVTASGQCFTSPECSLQKSVLHWPIHTSAKASCFAVCKRVLQIFGGLFVTLRSPHHRRAARSPHWSLTTVME